LRRCSTGGCKCHKKMSKPSPWVLHRSWRITSKNAASSPIIDEHLSTDPRRKVLTHGQAAVAMITAILFQVMQLYRICRFASEKKVLNVLLPQIEPEQYFDDRLADTLDALFAFGIGIWKC